MCRVPPLMAAPDRSWCVVLEVNPHQRSVFLLGEERGKGGRWTRRTYVLCVYNAGRGTPDERQVAVVTLLKGVVRKAAGV